MWKKSEGLASKTCWLNCQILIENSINIVWWKNLIKNLKVWGQRVIGPSDQTVRYDVWINLSDRTVGWKNLKVYGKCMAPGVRYCSDNNINFVQIAFIKLRCTKSTYISILTHGHKEGPLCGVHNLWGFVFTSLEALAMQGTRVIVETCLRIVSVFHWSICFRFSHIPCFF